MNEDQRTALQINVSQLDKKIGKLDNVIETIEHYAMVHLDDDIIDKLCEVGHTFYNEAMEELTYLTENITSQWE